MIQKSARKHSRSIESDKCHIKRTACNSGTGQPGSHAKSNTDAVVIVLHGFERKLQYILPGCGPRPLDVAASIEICDNTFCQLLLLSATMATTGDNWLLSYDKT